MYERIKNRIPYSPIVTPDSVPVDPVPTPVNDCEKQIAGYKSRITDLTNKLEAEVKAHAVDKTEIVNLNDKLANTEDKCQREKALLQGEIDVLKTTSSNVEVLKKQYMGTISDLEGKLREAQKATGLVQLDLAACQADTTKVSALSRLLQWLFHYGDNKT
jgi:chromosome segregation ATPase